MKTDIFVKTLLKNKNKIMNVNRLKKIYQNIDPDGFSDQKFYKQIYYVKNKGVLLSLKKDLFFVKNYNQEIEIDDIIEKFYRKVLKDYVQTNFGNNYFISGQKALEVQNNNFEILEKISIINPFKRSDEVLFKDRVVSNSKYSIKNEDDTKSFKIYKKQTEKKYIGGKMFFVSNYELSLLESLYSIPTEQERYIIELVKKNIRKNYKKIRIEVFEYFLKYGKYGSSVSKLYEISLGIRPYFAEKIKEILKRRYYF